MLEDVALGEFGYRFRRQGEPDGARRAHAAVFVHGWTGDPLGTWTAKPAWYRRLAARVWKAPPSNRLFDLLAEHAPGLDFDCFALRHAAGLSRIEIEQVADLLLEFLDQHVDPAQPVVLVAHSLGGLACRHAVLELLCRPAAERKHSIVGLLLYGTPNTGTQLARLAGRFSRSARQMAPLSAFVSDLNRDWAERVINGGRPERDPGERAEVLCWNAVGVFDRVVPASSAAGLAHLGDVHTLPKDHVGLPKATSALDSSYLLLVKFLNEAARAARERPRTLACARLEHDQRRRLRTCNWVEEEEEHIALEPEDGRYRYRVHQTRRGGFAQSSFRFCVQAEGLAGPPGALDYQCRVGAGLLPEKEFGAIVQGLESPAPYLTIEALSVVQGGRRFDFRSVAEEELRGVGWVVWTWRAPEGLVDGARYESLELVLSSYLERKVGWYYYDTPRTVTRRLVVDLRAPFRLNCHQRLRRGAMKSMVPHADGGWTSQVIADGPIAAGSDLYWFFLDA